MALISVNIGPQHTVERIKGRTAEEEVGITLMNGSSSDLHMAIVPPAAFLGTKGSSGERRSTVGNDVEIWKSSRVTIQAFSEYGFVQISMH